MVKGTKQTDGTKMKISAANKGRVFSSQIKERWSALKKGRHWYTDGTNDKQCYDDNIPDGWYRGRSKTRGRVQSEEEKEKRRQSALKRTDYHSFHLTDEQKQRESNAKRRMSGRLR